MMIYLLMKQPLLTITALSISADAFTYSKAKTSWLMVQAKKEAHEIQENSINFKHKFLLGSYFMSHLLFMAG